LISLRARTVSRFSFDPSPYARELAAILAEIEAGETLDHALRRHPKDGRGFFSKSEIVAGARLLGREVPLRAAPVRSQSGITAVTVLTRPHPCPGRCVFCPNDVRMPKSYLADEPGCQRATAHRFDPYAQTQARLDALRRMGHRVDKVELIVLGGTWSYYPEAYRVWFVTRCLEALNGVERSAQAEAEFEGLRRQAGESYNRTVAQRLRGLESGFETAPWEELEAQQRRNEAAEVRCVGLSLETRPDEVTQEEVLRLRRLGATKVQLGIQSLSDEVLVANQRGHDVATTRQAARLLREAGFKIHAHWMANLLGSTPERDVEDFGRLFEDKDFRPDELKIYPCSLVASAELMQEYRAGRWRPYGHEELLDVVTACMQKTPRWCRLTRVVRDIPSPDIVVGNKKTNFREIAEAALERPLREIRSREIRGQAVGELELKETEYETSVGRERFLEFVTAEDRIVGFLRLSVPKEASFVRELGRASVVRELHVYGDVAGLGLPGRSQHRGLGKRLLEAAGPGLAVIAAVGTRGYYRRLGFRDGPLYQHLS
jgi:elongator complex protein 3